MQYLRVEWRQHDPTEPVTLYSELDEQRFECRKVEIFRDGSVGFADVNTSVGTTRLGELSVPNLEEINQSEEFEATAIGLAEFEAVWTGRTARRVASRVGE